MLSFFKRRNTSDKYNTMIEQEPPNYDIINNVHHVYSFQLDMPLDYDVDDLPSYEKVMNYGNFVQIIQTGKTDKPSEKSKKVKTNLSFVDDFVQNLKQSNTEYIVVDNTKYKPHDIINKIVTNNYDHIVLYHVVNQKDISQNKKDNKYFSVNGNELNGNDIMILGTVDTVIKFENFTSNKYKSPYPYYHIHHNNGKYFSSVISYKTAFTLNLKKNVN